MKKRFTDMSFYLILMIITVFYLGIIVDSKQLYTVDDFVIEYGTPISTNVEDYLDKEKIKTKRYDNLYKKTKVSILEGYENEDELYQQTGTYTVVLNYEYEQEDVKVTIKDTVAPTFIDFKESVDTYKDVPVDLAALYGAQDLDEVTISVDDSNVDYTKEGSYTAIINASDTSNNVTSKEVTINVNKPTIALNTSALTLYKGNSSTLSTSIGGKEQTAAFASSDTNIATVEQNGKVIAKNVGTTTITASANGVSDTCTITVKNIPVGKSIYFKSPNELFSNPSNYNFGKYQNYAEEIYGHVLNGENFINRYEFDSEDDLNHFEQLFNEKVLKDFGAFSMTLVNTKNDKYIGQLSMYIADDYETYSITYNACQSAGLYNGMNELTAVTKINNWICGHMTYQLVHNFAKEGFLTGVGKCSTYAYMLTEMCDFVGIRSQYVTGTAGGGLHAWNRVNIGGVWYYIDPTWNDSTGNSYFLSETLWSDHSV